MKPHRLTAVMILLLTASIVFCSGCATTKRVGRYFGNRGLDLCDTVSLEAGCGWGVRPRLQITRWCQLGLGARYSTRGAGTVTPFWEWKRQWGCYQETCAEFSLGPYSFEYCKHTGIITKESYTVKKAGLNRPSEDIYRTGRDFWAITLLYAGFVTILPIPGAGAEATVDFHPVEFADFWAGWFGADICHDDTGEWWGFRGREAEFTKKETE